MKVSVVISAYNEEKRIGLTLRQIHEYMKKKKYEYEPIIVDDGSSDGTLTEIRKTSLPGLTVLKNRINRGKGHSVKRGLLQAKHPLVLFSDCDLATPIEELEKFVKYVRKGYDAVIASRNLKDSNVIVKQPFYRQILGKTFPLLVNAFVLKGFKDTQCGFKLFRTEVARKIVKYQTSERFSFDVEILLIAGKMGLKVKEVPVRWIDRKGSTLNTFRDTPLMLYDLIKIKYNDLTGKYNGISKGCKIRHNSNRRSL